MVHKTKNNKSKTQDNMSIRKQKNIKLNKTWALLQTTGGKTNCTSFLCRNPNEHRKTKLRTSKHIMGQQKILKTRATRTPPKKPVVNSGVREGKQFLLLIRYPSCYSYIQSSPVRILAVIEEENIYVYLQVINKSQWVIILYAKSSMLTPIQQFFSYIMA